MLENSQSDSVDNSKKSDDIGFELRDIPYEQINAEMGCRRQNLISLTVRYYDAFVVNKFQYEGARYLQTDLQELQRLWSLAELSARVVQDGVEKLIHEFPGM